MNTVVWDAYKIRTKSEEKRKEGVQSISSTLVEATREYECKKVLGFSGLSGCGMTIVYMLVKVIYVAIVAVQFYMVTMFLDADDDTWVLRAVRNLFTGAIWEDSPTFPRVTMCDLRVRDFANIQNHSVQCILMLNMINEKIFLFEWLWFGLLLVLSLISASFWLMRLTSLTRRVYLIRRWISYLGQETIGMDEACLFADDIQLDGFLALQFIQQHAGDRVTSEIAREMKKQFEMMRPKKLMSAPSQDDHMGIAYPTLKMSDEKVPIV